jgi:hypothetical protein
MRCRTLDTPAILVEVPLPGSSERLRSALGTLHLFGSLVEGGTRERAHQAADHVTQHTPRTLFRLGNCHCTCCLVRPTARLASRSAIRVHFLADAACRVASNAGAKRDLGLCERKPTLYSRDANATTPDATALDATLLTQTPRTNSTHWTRSAAVGRLTRLCGVPERRLKGYAGSARRENRTTRGATTRLETLRTTCTVHSPSASPVFYLRSGDRANISSQLVACRAHRRRKRGPGKFPQLDRYPEDSRENARITQPESGEPGVACRNS